MTLKQGIEIIERSARLMIKGVYQVRIHEYCVKVTPPYCRFTEGDLFAFFNVKAKNEREAHAAAGKLGIETYGVECSTEIMCQYEDTIVTTTVLGCDGNLNNSRRPAV